MTENTENSADQHTVIGMRAMEIIVAILLMAFGLTIAVASYKLGAQWADDGPQAGYFPFYIGVIITLSSLVTLIQAILGRTGGASKGFVERGQLKQVMAVLVPALVYVLGIQWFGIYLASAVYGRVYGVARQVCVVEGHCAGHCSERGVVLYVRDMVQGRPAQGHVV